ncbi:MAG: HAMP domain-containing sensor histidine kinase [candidate division WOR-3 bacterium]
MGERKEQKLAYLLIFVRPFVTLSILGVGVYFYKIIGINTFPLLWIIIASFLLSFFFFVTLSMGRPLWYMQLIGDLSIVSAIVYFTGGYDSIFSILYFIPLILSVALLGIKGGFLITTLISIFYTSILIIHFFGYVPVKISENPSAHSIFYKAYIHDFSFYIVFLLTSYLALRFKREKERADRKEEELKLKEKVAFIGEITSGLAHEIKNPLTCLLGSIETLKKIKDEEKKNRLISLMEGEAERIKKVIDTFTRYAKLKEPIFQEVNPEILIKAQIEEMGEKGKSIMLKVKGNSSDYRIDPELFLLLFRNLLNNAIEAQNGNPEVEVDLIFNKNNFVLKIIDKGKGIPEEIKDKIWNPFFTTKKEGLGMGLALVKRIAESHFAKINIYSKSGKGTEVEVIFPKI